MTELGSAAMVQLVARREITTRARDKSFVISSLVIVLLILGGLALQVALNSGEDRTRIGVVGGSVGLQRALEAQGAAVDARVTVVELDDVAAARAAVADGDVDGALIAGAVPELIVKDVAGGPLQAVVQGAVAKLSLEQQLEQAGVSGVAVPQVSVTPLDPDADLRGERTVAAVFGVSLLYGLLLMFGQFIAQGVVEEKASRVVKLLLATMRPW